MTGGWAAQTSYPGPDFRGPLMSDVTRILSAIEQGDPSAAEELLPLVYAELRRLAAARLAHEKPGQTLDPTALVHEAYLRLVDGKQAQQWNSRGHFFAAAAEAMRRILVERARRKGRIRHGGGVRRVDLPDAEAAAPADDEQVLLLDDALARLAAARPQAAELVKLRFFAGLTLEEVAPLLGLSPRTARRLWAFARAWLRRDMEESGGPAP
jgi:RNA polymerase sigma factor (TIGR02999 family)